MTRTSAGVQGRTFGRVGLGAVLHDPEPEFVTWWTSLIVDGLNDGDQVLNNHSVPTEKPMPVVHNALVRLFLKTDLDSLVLVEDDHDGPSDTIRRMRSKPANQPFDIVCASYPARRGRPIPPGWTYTGKTGPLGYLVNVDLAGMKRRGTQEYDGAALGCVIIRRWVLEAMRGGLPLVETEWFRCIGQSTLDLDFYIRAKALGARVGVDRDVWLDHYGKFRWARSDWEEAQRQNRWRWRWQILRERLKTLFTRA